MKSGSLFDYLKGKVDPLGALIDYIVNDDATGADVPVLINTPGSPEPSYVAPQDQSQANDVSQDNVNEQNNSTDNDTDNIVSVQPDISAGRDAAAVTVTPTVTDTDTSSAQTSASGNAAATLQQQLQTQQNQQVTKVSYAEGVTQVVSPVLQVDMGETSIDTNSNTWIYAIVAVAGIGVLIYVRRKKNDVS